MTGYKIIMKSYERRLSWMNSVASNEELKMLFLENILTGSCKIRRAFYSLVLQNRNIISLELRHRQLSRRYLLSSMEQIHSWWKQHSVTKINIVKFFRKIGSLFIFIEKYFHWILLKFAFQKFPDYRSNIKQFLYDVHWR